MYGTETSSRGDGEGLGPLVRWGLQCFLRQLLHSLSLSFGLAPAARLLVTITPDHYSCLTCPASVFGGHCVSKVNGCRLVEALENYDGRNGGGHDLGMPSDLMDTYASEDVESQLLGGGKGHRVSIPAHLRATRCCLAQC